MISIDIRYDYYMQYIYLHHCALQRLGATVVRHTDSLFYVETHVIANAIRKRSTRRVASRLDLS